MKSLFVFCILVYAEGFDQSYGYPYNPISLGGQIQNPASAQPKKVCAIIGKKLFCTNLSDLGQSFKPVHGDSRQNVYKQKINPALNSISYQYYDDQWRNQDYEIDYYDDKSSLIPEITELSKRQKKYRNVPFRNLGHHKRPADTYPDNIWFNNLRAEECKTIPCKTKTIEGLENKQNELKGKNQVYYKYPKNTYVPYSGRKGQQDKCESESDNESSDSTESSDDSDSSENSHESDEDYQINFLSITNDSPEQKFVPRTKNTYARYSGLERKQYQQSGSESSEDPGASDDYEEYGQWRKRTSANYYPEKKSAPRVKRQLLPPGFYEKEVIKQHPKLDQNDQKPKSKEELLLPADITDDSLLKPKSRKMLIFPWQKNHGHTKQHLDSVEKLQKPTEELLLPAGITDEELLNPKSSKMSIFPWHLDSTPKKQHPNAADQLPQKAQKPKSETQIRFPLQNDFMKQYPQFIQKSLGIPQKLQNLLSRDKMLFIRHNFKKVSAELPESSSQEVCRSGALRCVSKFLLKILDQSDESKKKKKMDIAYQYYDDSWRDDHENVRSKDFDDIEDLEESHDTDVLSEASRKARLRKFRSPKHLKDKIGEEAYIASGKELRDAYPKVTRQEILPGNYLDNVFGEPYEGYSVNELEHQFANPSTSPPTIQKIIEEIDALLFSKNADGKYENVDDLVKKIILELRISSNTPETAHTIVGRNADWNDANGRFEIPTEIYEKYAEENRNNNLGFGTKNIIQNIIQNFKKNKPLSEAEKLSFSNLMNYGGTDPDAVPNYGYEYNTGPLKDLTNNQYGFNYQTWPKTPQRPNNWYNLANQELVHRSERDGAIDDDDDDADELQGDRRWKKLGDPYYVSKPVITKDSFSIQCLDGYCRVVY